MLFGSARHDENGKYTHGKPGDQTHEEVVAQEWYLHRKGWYVLRAKDPGVQAKLSYAMRAACENEHFGYSQSDRMSGYKAAREVGFDPGKVGKDVNVDCSELVRICLAYAGIRVQDFDTSGEKTLLMSTGQFFDPFEVTSASECLSGDILVTKTKGHTGICVQ